ncbi:hypothetical protein GXSOP10_1195 [Armatimonadetes bacterium GXS]|nr:3',5'-cyclic adenosine monophosphate phosphodiesterase CpdA [bacterium HR14]CUU34817.1 hypothetical protein GXSOP10_1195 [Armatimonadetes bacterium GXS]
MLGLLGVLTAITGTGLGVGRWTRIRVETLPLPVQTPVRIAVLTDTHLVDDLSVRHLQSVLQQVYAHQPDLIVIVGDVVSSRKDLPYIRKGFKGIRAPLGVYAVLGNHDHWSGGEAVRRELEALGITVLMNESRTLRKGEAEFILAGIDDLYTGNPNWERTFRAIPPNPKQAVILLSHNPDAALSPYRNRAHLILSGHTHAGQIWVPPGFHRLAKRLLGRSFLPQTEYGITHPYGLKREGKTWVYVSSGVTLGRSVPRWFTRPEAVIIECTPP